MEYGNMVKDPSLLSEIDHMLTSKFSISYLKRQSNFVIKTLILDYELKSNLENFCHFVSAAKSN